MAKRTFDGLIYEWTEEVSKKNPQKRFGGVELRDIKLLKAKLKKHGFCVEAEK